MYDANWVGITAASCGEQVLLSGIKSQNDHCGMFEKELCLSSEGQQKNKHACSCIMIVSCHDRDRSTI